MQWEQGAEVFLEALSSDEPTPGGGTAAAMVGAMGCALLLMSIGTTLKRKSTAQPHKILLKQYQNKFSDYQKELKDLMQKDAQAYASYIAAYRLPAQDPCKQTAVQQALWTAATVPADVASHCSRALQEIKSLQPLIAPIIFSDVLCARHLLQSALACSLENIRINLQGLTEPARIKELKQLLEVFEKEIEQ